MATPTTVPAPEKLPSSLELRTKRWTAVAVVCFMGLLAALPFRSAPPVPSATVASSHRERSLRFRAEAAEPTATTRLAAEPPKASVQPVRSQPKPAISTPSVSLESPITSHVAETNEPAAVAEPIATKQVGEPSLVDSTWRSKASSAAGNIPKSCVAQKGENLMDIAERVLGDRLRWKELVELNPKYRSGFDEVVEGEEILTPGSR